MIKEQVRGTSGHGRSQIKEGIQCNELRVGAYYNCKFVKIGLYLKKSCGTKKN